MSQQGEQVVGHALGIFTHDSTRVRSRWVEVTEQGRIPDSAVLLSLREVVALGFNMVRDETLDGGFGVAIGVGRADGALFRDWNHVFEAGCVAIHRCRGGKDDVGNIMSCHARQEADGAVHIGAVVFQGDLARLANGLVTILLMDLLCVSRVGLQRCPESFPEFCCFRVTHLQCSKVNDAVNVWVRLEDFVKILLFADIDLEELGAFAADELNAIDDLL